MPLQPSDVLVICLLAFALIGVPAIIAFFVFGLLRREPPTDPVRTPYPIDAEAERVGSAPRHGRRRASQPHTARRDAGFDLRNRFGRR